MTSLLVVLLIAVFLGGTTGCVASPPEPDRCGWLRSGASAPQDAGRTVILVDVSNSTRLSSQQAGAPDFLGVLREHVRQAVARRDVVSIGSFSGSGAEPFWTASNQHADYTTDNPDNENDRRNDAITCLEDALGKASKAAPAVPGTDVLGAMRAAADRVREGKSGKTIVMATDGLPTSGCADLVNAKFGGNAEIDSIERVCSERAEVRAGDLPGVRLVMRGIGRPSLEQPAASPTQLQWLEQLWRRLCRANGARDEQCEITTGAVAGVADTVTPVAVPTVADPVVSFSDRLVSYEIPADILFDTSSAELRPEARTALARIAVDVRTRKYSTVEVHGHTDSRASDDNSQRLGQRRADKVAQFLSDEGLRNIVPRSFGETRLKCPNEFPGGVPDAAALQCNRRVEIVVTLA